MWETHVFLIECLIDNCTLVLTNEIISVWDRGVLQTFLSCSYESSISEGIDGKENETSTACGLSDTVRTKNAILDLQLICKKILVASSTGMYSLRTPSSFHFSYFSFHAKENKLLNPSNTINSATSYPLPFRVLARTSWSRSFLIFFQLYFTWGTQSLSYLGDYHFILRNCALIFISVKYTLPSMFDIFYNFASKKKLQYAPIKF
jgi:hypothetical protein